MKTKITLFILAIIIFSIAFAERDKFKIHQNQLNDTLNYFSYYLKVYKADSLFDKNKYDECYQILNEVFQNQKPLNRLHYYEYEVFLRAAYLTKHYEPIDTGVYTLVRNFGYNLEYFERDSILYNIFLKSSMDLYEYKVARSKYISKINFYLRDSIRFYLARNKFAIKNYSTRKISLKEKDSIVQLNIVALIQIFDKFGYPNEDLIGNNSINDGFLDMDIQNILLFANDSMKFHELKPRLYTFIKKGDYNPQYYAELIDQYYLFNNQPILYGTIKYAPLRDSTNINSIRHSIGLPTFRKYFKKNNF